MSGFMDFWTRAAWKWPGSRVINLTCPWTTLLKSVEPRSRVESVFVIIFCALYFRFPAGFIFAAPELHRFGIVKDVAGLLIYVYRMTDSLGNIT